jgi:hypothetical protein
MTYTPIVGQIWPQGHPRQKRGNRYSGLIDGGQYLLEGYSQPFSTDAIPADPEFDKVTLLLDMEGAAGSSTFVDRSNAQNTITPFNGAVISNVRTKFGSGSYSNDNQNRYLEIGGTANLSFSGDFTIEVWFWADASQPAYPAIFEIGSYTNGILFRPYHSGGGLWINGTNCGDFLNETLLPKQQWNHAAFVRSGSSFVCYLNGQIDKTATISTTVNGTLAPSRFGGATHTSGQHLNGYIDEVRVTRGFARYLAPFTPPTEPFPIAGIPEPGPQLQPPPIVLSQISYSQSSVYPGTTAITNSIMTNGSITDTGAATNSGAFEFIKMDLGYMFAVGSVVIGTATSNIPGGWSKSYTQGKTVSYSIDDNNWITAFNTGTFATDGIYTFGVGFNARYIRIESNGWLAVSEFYALSPEPEPEPPSGSDPDFSSVSLLLHMDGTNGSTVFTDSSSNALAVTALNNAQISTAQSKFGGASGLFDGSGDYLLSAADGTAIGTGDFTIEGWIRTVDGSSYRCIASLVPDSDNNSFYVLNNTLIWYDGGVRCQSGTFSNNVWYHVAVTRSSGTVRVFLDGTVSGATFSSTANIGNNTTRIGTRGAATGEWFHGYIDELRITKGIARYTASFTPPTASFPDAQDSESESSSDYWSSWVQQNYGWWPESYPVWWAG